MRRQEKKKRPKADKTIYVKVNEIETVVHIHDFHVMFCVQYVKESLCSTFRPYSTRCSSVKRENMFWFQLRKYSRITY